jgi:hypothetical protein
MQVVKVVRNVPSSGPSTSSPRWRKTVGREWLLRPNPVRLIAAYAAALRPPRMSWDLETAQASRLLATIIH